MQGSADNSNTAGHVKQTGCKQMPLTTLLLSSAHKRLTQCAEHKVYCLHARLLSSGTLLLYRDLREGAIAGKPWNGNSLVTPAISYTSCFYANGVVIFS